jgi:hypothetical protein
MFPFLKSPLFKAWSTWVKRAQMSLIACTYLLDIEDLDPGVH